VPLLSLQQLTQNMKKQMTANEVTTEVTKILKNSTFLWCIESKDGVILTSHETPKLGTFVHFVPLIEFALQVLEQLIANLKHENEALTEVNNKLILSLYRLSQDNAKLQDKLTELTEDAKTTQQ
jgi:hypothetical protein